jgi:hypothetical protein
MIKKLLTSGLLAGYIAATSYVQAEEPKVLTGVGFSPTTFVASTDPQTTSLPVKVVEPSPTAIPTGIAAPTSGESAIAQPTPTPSPLLAPTTPNATASSEPTPLVVPTPNATSEYLRKNEYEPRAAGARKLHSRHWEAIQNLQNSLDRTMGAVGNLEVYVDGNSVPSLSERINNLQTNINNYQNNLEERSSLGLISNNLNDKYNFAAKFNFVNDNCEQKVNDIASFLESRNPQSIAKNLKTSWNGEGNELSRMQGIQKAFNQYASLEVQRKAIEECVVSYEKLVSQMDAADKNISRVFDNGRKTLSVGVVAEWLNLSGGQMGLYGGSVSLEVPHKSYELELSLSGGTIGDDAGHRRITSAKVPSISENVGPGYENRTSEGSIETNERLEFREFGRARAGIVFPLENLEMSIGADLTYLHGTRDLTVTERFGASQLYHNGVAAGNERNVNPKVTSGDQGVHTFIPGVYAKIGADRINGTNFGADASLGVGKPTGLGKKFDDDYAATLGVNLHLDY